MLGRRCCGWGLALLLFLSVIASTTGTGKAWAQCGGFVVTPDPCLLICPASDVVFKVQVTTPAGAPVCLPTGSIWLDFVQCPATPCPEEPNWPRVLPDSCNPASGVHYFTIDAGMNLCTQCNVGLFINGQFCQAITARCFDTNGDRCVTSADLLGSPLCNDYNCDGAYTVIDQNIWLAHRDHCCQCPVGPPFCDSIKTDPCLLICPQSDIVFKVVAKDSCGHPICTPTPSVWLDFSQCPAVPCPNEEPNWPRVFPDSCDAATGTHYFTVDASLLDCTVCQAALVVNGVLCRFIPTSWLDINGDHCVTDADFIPGAPCSDLDCDGLPGSAADFAVHAAHKGHCCTSQPCPLGPPFCDSTVADPCLLICPKSDIVYKVQVKDSCGNPICSLLGQPPAAWLDFSQCPAIPCPNGEPNWPRVFPDSCDAATGTHYFTVDASLLDCTVCQAALFVNGTLCRFVPTNWLDVNGDHCVTDVDFLPGAPCSDLDCDGLHGSPIDQAIHAAHLNHCCASQPCPPGPAFCDSIKTDPCLLVCPKSDEVFKVQVKDSCGNPICGPAAAPVVWLDFSGCPARPCANEEPAWPRVFPDSCDAATGTHYFTVDASLLDCTDCFAMIFVDGKPCREVPAKFFDTNGDGCVKPNDLLGNSCNDYDCDGAYTPNDQMIFTSHLCHCCNRQCIVSLTGDVNGDNLITSADIIWLVNHIFKGGPAPRPCPAAGDVNCDGVLTSADIIVLVNFVFKSGPRPCDVCSIIPLKWLCCPFTIP
jgi:hypothetical protein